MGLRVYNIYGQQQINKSLEDIEGRYSVRYE